MKLLPIISLHYPANRYSNENIQTYQVEVIMILHQILITNLQGYMQQLEERIGNEILGVKRLIVAWNV